jgi:polyribonucleotide nucleotidyltransferase
MYFNFIALTLKPLQENGHKDFEVGEELLVKCSSFNAKGIPVFSLLD